jgi:hypothetical protein
MPIEWHHRTGNPPNPRLPHMSFRNPLIINALKISWFSMASPSGQSATRVLAQFRPHAPPRTPLKRGNSTSRRPLGQFGNRLPDFSAENRPDKPLPRLRLRPWGRPLAYRLAMPLASWAKLALFTSSSEVQGLYRHGLEITKLVSRGMMRLWFRPGRQASRESLSGTQIVSRWILDSASFRDFGRTLLHIQRPNCCRTRWRLD